VLEGAPTLVVDGEEWSAPEGDDRILIELADGPHDVEVRNPDGSPVKPVEPTPGGESMAYQFDALPAGDYVFICSIHPIEQMTGTLKVQ